MQANPSKVGTAERPVTLNNPYRRFREESYELGMGFVNIPWAAGQRSLTRQPWPLASYPTNLHGITLKSR